MYFHQKFGSCTKGKGTALDLISSSEAWLNDNGIEKDTINILNGWLQKFGIRVGMSESEILKALDEFHLKTLESPVSENESSK